MKTVENFNKLVGIKFQLYNSLFTSLPFHTIEKTGILLSLLSLECEEGYNKNYSPKKILDNFFNKQTTTKDEKTKIDSLFQFIQYIERQVVLFDALEDAAYSDIYEVNGKGTLTHLFNEVESKDLKNEFIRTASKFKVHLVLTAHPTQFYRSPVLGIINDLSNALAQNDTNTVNTLLLQLGRTPFFKKEKPTPLDEAKSLVWYLENVFYNTIGNIVSTIRQKFNDDIDSSVISLGFWPGGDRDGNPFVNTKTTVEVAGLLKRTIINCYLKDIRLLKRRITFKKVEKIIFEIENNLNEHLSNKLKLNNTIEIILSLSYQVKEILINEYDSLFIELIDNFIQKIKIFGFHFASLDIRQESSIHTKLVEEIFKTKKSTHLEYQSLNETEKIDYLIKNNIPENFDTITDEVQLDTLDIIKTIKRIQRENSEKGCHRYIISQCNSALNVIEVLYLFKATGWNKNLIDIDIVPLFETIDDLENASSIMKTLYTNPYYKKHLQYRNNKQTIMLGFSDGTKDGGYLMANWSIYKTKEILTKLSLENNIEVIFFDGRGGPPSRGGGKTSKYYASMGNTISNKEIQLTIQGQTISSNFGTNDSCSFNIEQLINAGLYSKIFPSEQFTFNKNQEEIIITLARKSYKAYLDLIHTNKFVEYLLDVSPLKYYAETNIASRPTKRKSSQQFNLKDVRAIPYGGALSQIKQNITGFYGVGTALKAIEQDRKFKDVQEIYNKSLFFKTLLDNCEMAMKKCYFPLTKHLSQHTEFGTIWKLIYNEYKLTETYLKKLSGKTIIMEDYPVESKSIQIRERIVVPLLTIQQYALQKLRELNELKTKESTTQKELYEKLIKRCSFGIINAGRNSA